MTQLSDKFCIPCKQVTKENILTEEQINSYSEQIPEWKIIKGRRIRKIFVLKDFDEGIKFINEVAKLAKEHDHHPRIYIYKYNQVRIEYSTFSIGRRLTINDFILAAKIDLIAQNYL